MRSWPPCFIKLFDFVLPGFSILVFAQHAVGFFVHSTTELANMLPSCLGSTMLGCEKKKMTACDINRVRSDCDTFVDQ